MAWTSVGFDGTINEAQWSQMAGLLGNGYVAAGNGDCVVTAVGGARSVSVAAGSLYGDGVVSTNSGAETVAMTTPVNGQWYVIALRRTWATNTAALVAIAGATTSTTTPTAPPTSFPTLNTNVGVLTDQPIAWAWCNSANTTVVVYDLRMSPYKQTNPMSVSSVLDRDAKFPAPVQGTTVWRDDLGALETYYGLYNVSTNPGGRSAAGWYQEPAGRVLQVVNVKNNTNVATTSSTPVATSVSVSITPKYSTSKLYVQVEANGLTKGGGYGGGSIVGVWLYKNGSQLSLLEGGGGYNNTADTQNFGGVGYTNVETAGTTSSITYTIYISQRQVGTAYINQDGSNSTITVWEISA